MTRSSCISLHVLCPPFTTHSPALPDLRIPLHHAVSQLIETAVPSGPQQHTPASSQSAPACRDLASDLDAHASHTHTA